MGKFYWDTAILMFLPLLLCGVLGWWLCGLYDAKRRLLSADSWRQRFLTLKDEREAHLAKFGGLRKPAPAQDLSGLMKPVLDKIGACQSDILALKNKPVPKVEMPRMPDMTATLKPVLDKVGACQADILALKNRPAPKVDIPAMPKVDMKPVLDRVAACQADILALKNRPAPKVEMPPMPDMKPVLDRVAACQADIQALKNRPAPKVEIPPMPKMPDMGLTMKPVLDRVAACQADIQALKNRPAPKINMPEIPKVDISKVERMVLDRDQRFKRIDDAIAALSSRPQAGADTSAGLKQLETQVRAQHGLLTQSDKRLTALYASFNDEVSGLRKRLDQVSVSKVEAEKKVTRVVSENDANKRRIIELEKLLKEQSALAKRIAAQLSERDELLLKWKDTEGRLRGELLALKRAPAPRVAKAAPKKRVAKAAPKKRSTVSVVKAQAKPKWLVSKPNKGAKDDLKRIYGIGPVLEKTLNKLGVYYFKQIAGFQAKDIQWVADHIDTFPDRINRDKWVKQAGQYHRAKESGKLTKKFRATV